MKTFQWSKIARISLLIISFTVLTGATASAQSSNTGTGTSTQQTRVERDNDTDWGWLGLLGLAGLAGLMPRKRNVEVHDNNRTGNR